MDYFMHPAPPASRPDENAVVQELGKLAGGQLRIIGYCARQLGVTSLTSGQDGAGAPNSP
jgi:hypothetical protein